MSEKKLSRREFLRLSTLTAAGIVAASCAPKPAPTATPKPAEPTTAPPAKEVTLDVMSLAEYEGPASPVNSCKPLGEHSNSACFLMPSPG